MTDNDHDVTLGNKNASKLFYGSNGSIRYGRMMCYQSGYFEVALRHSSWGNRLHFLEAESSYQEQIIGGGFAGATN